MKKNIVAEGEEWEEKQSHSEMLSHHRVRKVRRNVFPLQGVEVCAPEFI